MSVENSDEVGAVRIRLRVLQSWAVMMLIDALEGCLAIGVGWEEAVFGVHEVHDDEVETKLKDE